MARRIKQAAARGSKRRPPDASRGGQAPSTTVEAEQADEPGLESADAADPGATVDLDSADDLEAAGLAADDAEIFGAARAGNESLTSENFDEEGYLQLNPDVQASIERGEVESGYAHYLWRGRAQGRPVPGSPQAAGHAEASA